LKLIANQGWKKMSFRDVPIPACMKHLDKDKRGYPIPFNVFRDNSGIPKFTVNDGEKEAQSLKRGLCNVSGLKLNGKSFFIGGPRSAFHKHGCYLDGPSRLDCLRYAAQVCPYIAAPIYSKRIDDKLIDWDQIDEHQILIDGTQDPDRPELFVISGTDETTKVNMSQEGMIYYHPQGRWKSVEFWQKGKKLSDQEALEAMKERYSDMDEWVYLPEKLKV
jgi:hypothetical protein